MKWRYRHAKGRLRIINNANYRTNERKSGAALDGRLK